MKEATKFENKFSYYKFLKLIGINYTLPDHYNSIIEHCIITGERSIPQKEKSKLEDEHSLPFMILLGILYPEALRLVLTRMSNEYNHKYISKDLIKQQPGDPLGGQNITMSSFTYRVIDQLKSNKTYNGLTFPRFFLMFHAYVAGSKFVREPHDIIQRFKNLRDIKPLIDQAHVLYHQNIATLHIAGVTGSIQDQSQKSFGHVTYEVKGKDINKLMNLAKKDPLLIL